MRACLIIIAVASATNLTQAVSDHSTATTLANGIQPEESTERFLRSYDMRDLNGKAVSGNEERGIDLTKLDDVINVAKVDKVIDTAKLDDVVNAAKVKAINAAKIDDVAKVAKAKVVDTAKTDDVIDEAKLKDMLDAEKIKRALKDPDNEATLFAQWHESKELSEAILKRLQGNGNFLKNRDIVIRYNNYRTRFAYNQQLTPWLDTKTLDATLDVFQKHGMKKLTEQFEVWFAAGRTQKQIADALKPHSKLAKKFKGLETYYGHFVDLQAIKIKRAAAAEAKKAAEEAAVAKKAAEIFEAS